MGPAGTVLEQCMHSAGIIRAEVYLTNVVKEQPPKNNIAPYFNTRTGAFTGKGMTCVKELQEELEGLTGPVVLIPLGKTASAAVTGEHEIGKWRGSILESRILPGVKAIPALHPATVLYANFMDRYLIVEDFKRAVTESAFKDLRLPEYTFILEPSFDTSMMYLEELSKKGEAVSWDIETVNDEVYCMAFAPDVHSSICIPVAEFTPQQERMLWQEASRLLSNPDIPKIGQNLIFDIFFTMEHNHIITKGPIYDTMIAHSLIYPDLKKGLATLCSLHTRQPYYKDDGKIWKQGYVDKTGKRKFQRYNCLDTTTARVVWNELEPQLGDEYQWIR